MRIAVIGGAGFIGAHLVEGLIREKNTVLVYDNLFSRGTRTGLPWLDRCEFVQAELSATLRSFRPDLLYHLGGFLSFPTAKSTRPGASA